MGFLKRRLERWLDFSERWNPNSILYRYIYLLIMFNLGIIFCLMIYTGHVLSLWEEPLTSEVPDTTMGIVFAVMFLITLAMETFLIYIYVRILRATKGMEMRQLRSRDAMTGAGVAEVLDSIGISYEVEVFDKEHRGSSFHERFYANRYSFREYNAAILMIRSFFGREILLIGPIDDLNRSFIKRLQNAIDMDMFRVEVPQVRDGTYSDTPE